jgi:hypothetical protein
MATITTPVPGRFGRPGTALARGVRVGRGWRRLLSPPSLTSPVTATYDAETGAFVLEWSRQIVGGPFNDFTGVWHMEGISEAAS